VVIALSLAGAALLAAAVAAVLTRSLVSRDVGGLLEQLGWPQIMPGMGHGMGRARWLAELFASSGFGAKLTQSIVIAGLAGAAIAGAIGYLGAARIARPLSLLSERIRRMAAGEYGRRTGQTGVEAAPSAAPSREPGGVHEVSEMQSALDTLSRQLAAAESLRRRLVEDLAHELRSPLTAIRGYTEGLRDGVFPDQAAALSGLQRELGRIERLITDLRRSALPSSPAEFWPVDFREVAVSAAHGLEAAARQKGIDFRIAADQEGPQLVMGDSDRLGQVVANLVDNAVKFTPPGGWVKVELGPQPGNPEGEIRLIVKDSGPGIPAKHLPHIFDRLYRAETSRARSTGGSGIGLAIVKQIVLLHGGTVEADSPRGGGAVFTVRLPRAQDAAPARGQG
jgi:signal transduction histidine kinase